MLRGAGGFQANYSAESGGPLQADFDAPQKEMWRFAAVMRPFLTPSSELFVEDLVEALEELQPHISEETVEAARDYLERRGSGPQITYKDQELTSDEIFEMVSQGGVFEKEDEAITRVREILDTPLGPVIWFGFFAYMEDTYRLVSGIYEAIREDGPMLPRQRGPSSLDPEDYQCIYCTKTDGPFESEEHYLPEGLGNYFAVLPKGYVCDPCNHGILSTLDQALVEFGPTALQRIATVPYTKDGDLPSIDLDGMTIQKTQPLHVHIEFQGEAAAEAYEAGLLETSAFQEEFLGESASPRIIGRALAKVALGYVAFERGHAAALDSRFDPLRRFILDGESFPSGYLILAGKRPEWKVEVQHIRSVKTSPLFLNLFGVKFVVPLLPSQAFQQERVYANVGSVLLRRDAVLVPVDTEVAWSDLFG